MHERSGRSQKSCGKDLVGVEKVEEAEEVVTAGVEVVVVEVVRVAVLVGRQSQRQSMEGVWDLDWVVWCREWACVQAVSGRQVRGRVVGDMGQV